MGSPHRANGTETILLVEDEESVRALVKRVLESRGYSVIEAVDGRAALVLCEAHARRIDLLLTDVVMPELGGRELAAAAVTRRPEMKVLFMSGYTGTEVSQQGTPAREAFLHKPFTPAQLAQRVRHILDA